MATRHSTPAGRNPTYRSGGGQRVGPLGSSTPIPATGIAELEESTPGSASPRHEEATRASRLGRVDRILAGLTIATLPLGSIAYESEGRNLLIAYSLLVGTLLVVHVLAGALAGRTQRGPLGRAFRLAAVILVAMFVPVLADGLQLRALVAYASFAGGTLCGLAIAAVWSTARRTFGFIDGCLALFIVVTAVQLRMSADSASTLHQAEVTWGASNYVAGTIVVASLATVARLLETPSKRWLWLIPAIGFASALSTLSRGAAVAGAFGLLILLWNSGRTTAMRVVLRASCLGLIIVAAEVFTTITEARSAGGYDPGQNIRARFTLAQIAWDEFASSPWTGTGWLALRDVDAFSVPISFAHNIVLSFLQIGGMFGLVFLIVLTRQISFGVTRRSAMLAAVAAAVAMAFSDPFFEGGVGALIAWSAIGYAAFAEKPSVGVPSASTQPGAVGTRSTSGPAAAARRKGAGVDLAARASQGSE